MDMRYLTMFCWYGMVSRRPKRSFLYRIITYERETEVMSS